jgi:acetamidase/formamidase
MATRGDRDHATGAGRRSFHAVRPDAFKYVWDNSIEPELEIDSGEVVEFRVRDASDEQLGPTLLPRTSPSSTSTM